MHVIGVKTSIFSEKGDIVNFILAHVRALQEKDIVVITSKIIALSQRRVVSRGVKKKLIYKESKKVIETPWASLTLMDDGWCINAGADESNARGRVILLPKNPHLISETIRSTLARRFSLRRLGTLITDTRSVPLRVGTIGRAIGYAGFKPLRSYVGKKDLFGRKSRFTQSNIADALAAAAVLVMGEGDEQIPIAIIRDAPVHFTAHAASHKKQKNLALSPTKDIFAQVFRDV